MFNKVFLLIFLVFSFSGEALAQRVEQIDLLPKQQVAINHIKNPSCTKNTTDITASGGSLSRSTTTPLDGFSECAIDASSSGQTYTWAARDFYQGELNQTCQASFKYEGDASLYKAYVKLGSNQVTLDVTLSNVSSGSKSESIFFQCGSSLTDDPTLVIESTSASAAAISVANVYLGLTTDVGKYFSQQIYTASINNNGAVSNENYDFISGDCSEGGVSPFTTTCTLVTGVFPSTPRCIVNSVNNADNDDSVSIKSVSTTSLVYNRFSGGTANQNIGVNVTCFREPANETAYRANELSWRVDANISGANPSLGTTSVSSYTGITNSALTLTNNSGNNVLTAQIPCSSTNSPSGTTCSSGDESIGVSFNLPKAGDVLACVSFSHAISNAAGTTVDTAFQLVETPSNAQTISQEGKSRILSASQVASTIVTLPHRLCGTFTFSSSGQKVIRLFYEQVIAGTPSANIILGDSSASLGQRDIHWEVYPIHQVGSPLIIAESKMPTVQRFTSGSGTYTTPDGVKYIKVKMVGGGGGGSGSGSASNGAGGTGGTTTFGTSLLSANGGTGGGAIGAQIGGTGGTCTINSPATAIVNATGGGGGSGWLRTSAALDEIAGGVGGSSALGGGGRAVYGGYTATVGAANTGGGGAGAGGNSTSGVTIHSGGGGGAGCYIEAVITSPSSTYSYSVATGGTAGTAGTNGSAGAVGGTGVIIVEEYYW